MRNLNGETEMKIVLYIFIILQIIVLFGCNLTDGKTLPRIAIAGLAIESSTFSPALTHKEAFHARRGDEVFTYYPFLSPDSMNRKRANWFPSLRGSCFTRWHSNQGSIRIYGNRNS